MRLQLVPGEGRPEFLELPWEVPLEDWETERLVIAREMLKETRAFLLAGVG